MTSSIPTLIIGRIIKPAEVAREVHLFSARVPSNKISKLEAAAPSGREVTDTFAGAVMNCYYYISILRNFLIGTE